jgi:hypothetical protein
MLARVALVEGVLRWVAILASLVILLSFAFFVADEAKHGSQTQQNQLSGTQSPNPTPANERARQRAHGKFREAVDDLDDDLLSPFTGIVSKHANKWVARGVPTLLALLIWGFGLGFLSRFMRARS